MNGSRFLVSTWEQIIDSIEGVCYLTEPNGKLTAIGARAWDLFATVNDDDELQAEAVVGRNIFEFIAGEEVRDAYREIYDSLLDSHRERAVFEFSCDSPSLARKMRMSISRVMDADRAVGLLHQSLTLSEQDRPPLNIFDPAVLLERYAAQRALPILTLCSYCQNIVWPPGGPTESSEWVSASEYYRRGGDENVRLSHGVCPHCYQAIVKDEFK
jgi:hypothetical protein